MAKATGRPKLPFIREMSFMMTTKANCFVTIEMPEMKDTASSLAFSFKIYTILIFRSLLK